MVNVFVQTEICRQFSVDLGSESVLIMTYVLTAIFCMAVVHVGGDPKLFKNNPSHRTGFQIRNGKQSEDGFDTLFGNSLTRSKRDHQGLDWLRDALPGEPGLDYPIYSLPTPDTSFDCSDKVRK